MSAAQALRTATAAAHDAVDAAYGRFDLGQRDDYAAFLTAHARVLAPVEAALAKRAVLPPFPPRTPALAADLGTLGLTMPAALPVTIDDDPATAWGIFYVVEGSRLGGVMLARSVADGLPRAYLSAAHGPGDWRTIRTAIDAADTGSDWTIRAIAAANRCFGWYGQAAG